MRFLFVIAVVLTALDIHPAHAAVQNAGEPRTLSEKAEQCAFVQQLTDPRGSRRLAADRDGEYVSKNYDEAFKWCHDAAEQGDIGAQAVMGGQYTGGDGVSQDYARGVKWFLRAANQGDTKSQLAIGLLYARGQGVRRDDAEALFWLALAANHGDQGAAAPRDDVQSRLTPGQISAVYRRVAEWKPHPDISQLRGKP
jgi:TPR repeat protein